MQVTYLLVSALMPAIGRCVQHGINSWGDYQGRFMSVPRLSFASIGSPLRQTVPTAASPAGELLRLRRNRQAASGKANPRAGEIRPFLKEPAKNQIRGPAGQTPAGNVNPRLFKRGEPQLQQGEKLGGLPKALPKRSADDIRRMQQSIVDKMNKVKNLERTRKYLYSSPSEVETRDAANKAVIAMGGGNPDEILLKDVKDPISGKILLSECKVKLQDVLGAGGVGAVMKLEVLSASDAAKLGDKNLALKLAYQPIAVRYPASVVLKELLAEMDEMLSQELLPLTTAVRKGHQSVRDILRQNKWALPEFQATIGDPTTMHILGNFAFAPHVTLSKVLLGDALLLLREPGPLTPASPRHIPMEASEFVCEGLIRSAAKLHGEGLVHQDIKLANLLISNSGDVYLADFGMVGEIGKPRKCGIQVTTLYMDPTHSLCAAKRGVEALGEAYDAWATGMTCHLLMTQTLPYNITEEKDTLRLVDERYRRRVKDPEEGLIKAGVSAEWAKIVAGLLVIERENRLTLRKIVSEYLDRKGPIEDGNSTSLGELFAIRRHSRLMEP